MNLHLIHTEKFKTTVMCLLLRQPLERDTATITAIIPSILARGSERYPTLSAINRELEDMYGSIFEAQVIKKAEEQIIQLYMEYMSGDEGLKVRALEFLRDIMKPVTEGDGFKAEYVAGEKANLKLSIESRINNKAEYAKLRAVEEMCRNERFGVYGDGYVEDIDTLTPGNIYGRYHEILTNAPVELLVMGNEDEAFERMARQILSFDQRDTLMPPTAEAIEREPQTIVEHCNITQGKLCMGFRTGAGNVGADVYRLMLMNEILGGGPGSKLFMNVREKENLCYYISSFVYRAKAIVFVQSGVEQSNFEKTEELVKLQVKELADGNVSEAELSNARKSLIKKLEGLKDSQAGYIDFYMSQRMLNDTDDFDTVLGEIERLGRDEICEMAGRMRLDTIYRLG